MDTYSFGAYLRELRKSKHPTITQEKLASAIGRKKMTISQFEQGKNSPPQRELLDKIIVVLELSEEEECKLRFLASEVRKTIPSDIEQYFFDNPSICQLIRIAQRKECDNDFWEQLSKQI